MKAQKLALKSNCLEHQQSIEFGGESALNEDQIALAHLSGSPYAIEEFDEIRPKSDPQASLHYSFLSLRFRSHAHSLTNLNSRTSLKNAPVRFVGNVALALAHLSVPFFQTDPPIH